jgi:hypothetical protein
MAGPLGAVSVDHILFNKTGRFANGLPCSFMGHFSDLTSSAYVRFAPDADLQARDAVKSSRPEYEEPTLRRAAIPSLVGRLICDEATTICNSPFLNP